MTSDENTERIRKAERLAARLGAGTRQEPEQRSAGLASKELLPLSFAQRRLWFLDQLEPNSSAYTIAFRQQLPAPLDVTALRQACSELLRRHEALRTTFESVDGEPMQRIAAPQPARLDVVDLADVPRPDLARRVEQACREEAQRPFDLARGPLFRPALLRLGADEHELLVSVHHIVADGWSIGILARELALLYDAFRRGEPPALPDPVLQYADYALWQRRWLTAEALTTQLGYWREQLGPRPPAIQLQTDHPRSTWSTPSGASHDFLIPRALADRTRELGRSGGATVFMTLLAAFKALIARYSDQEDIVVGAPVANRSHVELETVVGLFANTLALRTRLTGDPGFREILARVRETCLGAYANQDVPFEQLVESLQPDRVLGRNPLFQICFVYDGTAPRADLRFIAVGSPFELTLFVREGGDGTLVATLEYRADLFEPDTIARFASQYRLLLESVAANPDQRLSELPLLDEVERHRILVEWNSTATPYPRDRCVHALFEDQADATPDAVALASDAVSLTYRELDRRANRLAHHLRALGVGPERLVGVLMERSVDAIVALLAILKAGGAYLPFDLLAPERRLASMLSDAEVDVVLTQTPLLRRLSASRVHAICIDADAESIGRQPTTRPASSVSPENLAYVMYTSGSKSGPNGVAVTHRNIVRLVKETDYADFGPNEVFLQLTSLSFDVSTFEIWGALLNGSRLAVAPHGVLSVAELGDVVARHGVTTLWLTAGLFHQVVDDGADILRPLRTLVVGGDVVSPVRVRRLLARMPGLRLVNGYGPTETTTFACCHTITGTAVPDASVPIGRPIANTRVYVLDRRRRLVPVGVPGELWIAGDGVARGYLNRPALTAERFVVHQLSEKLQERLYKTGDRVRWRSDGTLEFLGRLDDQVKVRGHRVELGEIEATLAQHPHVRDVAVLARALPDGEKRLIAYVVSDAGVEPRELDEFLRTKLPAYMVPAGFVMLDSLPLSVNGKIDRHALPDTEESPGPGAVSGQPRDALERELAAIWRNLLGVPEVGIGDSFFDLGGHSLLAIRMLARIHEQMGVKVPVAALFEGPTIEKLAGLIRRSVGSRPSSLLVPIRPAGGRPPLFAIPGVGGDVLAFRHLGRLLPPDQPLYGLRSRGLDGPEEPLSRIEDIAADFVREIRAVQPDGPYYLVGACMGGVVAYEIAQQLGDRGYEVGLLGLLEAWPPPRAARRLCGTPRTRAMLAFAADRLRHAIRVPGGLRSREHLYDRLKPLARLLVRRRLPPDVRQELRGRAVIEGNKLAFERYRPRPYRGSAVLICAAQRPVDPTTDSRLAWRDLITGNLDVHYAPGDDSGLMLEEPQVRQVADVLVACIRRAQGSTSRRERS